MMIHRRVSRSGRGGGGAWGVEGDEHCGIVWGEGGVLGRELRWGLGGVVGGRWLTLRWVCCSCADGLFFGGGYEDYSKEVGLKVLVWRSKMWQVCGGAMFISYHSWVVPTHDLYRRGHERSLPLTAL
jgi:hypothetical protein